MNDPEHMQVNAYDFERTDLPELLERIAAWVRENVPNERAAWDLDLRVESDGTVWAATLYLGDTIDAPTR